VGFLDLNLARRRRGLRSGVPGEIGGGGLFSGPDPDNPAPMHYANDPEEPMPALRPRVVNPVASPDEVPALRPRAVGDPAAALPTPDAQEQTTRPRWSSELNRETEHNAAAREQFEHPQKAHGLKRWLVPLAEAALTGLSAGGPAGGVGGAGVGLLRAAFDPAAANKIKYGREVQRSDARLLNFEQARQRREAREGEALKRAQGVATYNETLARTDKLKREPTDKPHVVSKKSGVYLVHDNGKYEKLEGIPADESNAKFEWIDDGQGNSVLHKYDERDIPQPVSRPDGSFVTRPGQQLIDVPGYGKMSPAQKYAADKDGYAADVTASNENDDRRRDDERDARQAEFQAKQQRHGEARSLRDEYETKRTRLLTQQAEARALQNVQAGLGKDPKGKPLDLEPAEQDKLATLLEQNQMLLGEVLGLQRQLGDYNDYVSFDGSGQSKLAPAPPPPEAVGRSPVRSRRMPTPQAAPAPPKPPMTEDQFVAHVRETWGQDKKIFPNGAPPFDEAEARMRYRKRYRR
jgi:hypothetical protein